MMGSWESDVVLSTMMIDSSAESRTNRRRFVKFLSFEKTDGITARWRCFCLVCYRFPLDGTEVSLKK
jgi:hypothetical protein